MEQKNLEDGVHVITNDEYHSSQGISRSGLWMFKKNPYLYWYNYLNPDAVRTPPTPDMVMGSLVHTLALEPDNFLNEFAVKPELEKLPEALKLKDVGHEAFDHNKAVREALTNENNQRLAEFEKEAETKSVIASETFTQAKAIADAVLSDATAASLIDGAKIENSIYWTCERTGLKFKSRPDAWLGGIVTDLKTTRSANPRDFQGDLYKGGYHIQAAMASKALGSIGMKLEKFIFLCVEKKPPYLTSIFILDDEAIEYGIHQFEQLSERFAECIESDRWPSYGVQTIGLPGWSKYDGE